MQLDIFRKYMPIGTTFIFTQINTQRSEITSRKGEIDCGIRIEYSAQPNQIH